MTGELAGARNGLYRAPRDPRQTHLPAAHRCVVDLSRAQDKQGLLAAFAQALRFPPDFGWNWDALADGLEDLSWLEGEEGVVVDIREAGVLASRDAADWAVALDILRDAARYWQAQKRPFVVFVQSADPLPEWDS